MSGGSKGFVYYQSQNPSQTEMTSSHASFAGQSAECAKGCGQAGIWKRNSTNVHRQSDCTNGKTPMIVPCREFVRFLDATKAIANSVASLCRIKVITMRIPDLPRIRRQKNTIPASHIVGIIGSQWNIAERNE